MEDVRIELLLELEERIRALRPKVGFTYRCFRDLTYSEIEDYVEALEGYVEELEEQYSGGGIADFIRHKRVSLENAALAQEALSRVR